MGEDEDRCNQMRCLFWFLSLKGRGWLKEPAGIPEEPYVMKLTINGEVAETIRAATVQELLDELKIASGRVAVEVNLTVVRKAEYGTFPLIDGDTVEIVNFVGGG